MKRASFWLGLGILLLLPWIAQGDVHHYGAGLRRLLSGSSYLQSGINELSVGAGLAVVQDPTRPNRANLTATGGGAPSAHATTHVTGGTDVISNAVASGNAGLLSGADKAKLDGIASGADDVNETTVTAAFPISDATALVHDPSDTSRRTRIDVGAVGASTTRTIFMPDSDVYLEPGTTYTRAVGASIGGGFNNTSILTTRWFSGDMRTVGTSEGAVDGYPLPAACSIRNLRVLLGAAPGGSTSWVITVRINGSDSAVTCSIAGTATTCSDTTHAAAASAGDVVTIAITETGGDAAGTNDQGVTYQCT